MRISVYLAASLTLSALTIAQPRPAAAEDKANWQACIGLSSKPDERVAACSAVIDANSETGPRLAAAFCNRGHAFTVKHELDHALADLDDAIKIDPTSACAYTNRGRVYAFQRDLDRAIADYDEAIRINPSFALAYNNRGDARFGKGDLDGAMADFSMAIKSDPTLAIAYGNRGFLPITASATCRMRSRTSRRKSNFCPTCWRISTAATPIAIPNSSIMRKPIMPRRSRLRPRTRAAGATAA